MANRERRKARAKARKELNAVKFDQQFEKTLGRVRTEFERTGKVISVFECLTDDETFRVPVNWPDDSAKAAACSALKDCFRRRGVNRYVFISEGWVGKTPGLVPADDPDHGESVVVLAVERNGRRRYASAEITRTGQTAILGPWQVSSEVPPSWLAELLEDGYSDRSIKPEPPPLGEISNAEFAKLQYLHPAEAAGFHDSFEIHSELSDLIDNELQEHGDEGPMDLFIALESVLLSIVKDAGSPKGIREFARFLRDYPDGFPMFAEMPEQVPSPQRIRCYKAVLGQFNCEKRKAGHISSAIFGAFMNMYMDVGAQAVGALELAARIEDWIPEGQAKLREVGLRSSFELDDEEGHVFIALTADRYPVGIMGRRDATGDLFVSKVVALSQAAYDAAVEEITQKGFELILGSEANDLLSKMEQVTGTLLKTDKKEEIWEVEGWGTDEFLEQALAGLAFAKTINVQYAPDRNNLDGNVAGYRVRRAQNGLVLVPSDGDQEIFVAVKIDSNKRGAEFVGWLRGSEGKRPQFYQKNRWVIPAEALHTMDELPGTEALRSMPPYEEMP
jgi:hypothetical protein